MVAVGAAMRGRYLEDGTTEQQIECNYSEYANCITSVQKDSLVIIKNNTNNQF